MAIDERSSSGVRQDAHRVTPSEPPTQRQPGSQPSSRPASTGRLKALDGLRGVAALVVVLHHTMLVTGTFPASMPTDFAGGSLEWWLSFSPLKVLTAGWESVMVFFVLSGLVVSLPVLKNKGFDWVAYYPRRVVRLLVPVMGSVLVAALWVMAIPQVSKQASGTWLSSSSTPNFSWEYIVKGMDLFGGDGQINNPVWSLRWELLFSLLLPLFVIGATVIRKWWLAGLAGCVFLTWLGLHSQADSLTYLPVFFIGAMIAVGIDDVRRFTDRVNRLALRNLIWLGFLLAGSMLLVVSWFTGPLPKDLTEITTILRALTPLAAGMLVVGCLGWPALGALLSMRPFQFVGKISFSLYLTHVPVIIFSHYLFGGYPLIYGQLFGIAVSLMVAVAFWWVFERHSHGWSKRAGVWASERFRSILA
ncbi:MAG: acyltransferase [Microbacteriaceae bacterium]